ncbi:folylpolyglutamate synthase [Ascochyta clinopodiicola]|nr:folylpolyglutamate synthase [Ascochyta clinopodiicola]
MAKIQPGLERIAALLKNLQFPWRTIHVAGTNGKGSICHHASSLLVGANIKVGMFTSPHLVDRWDCISINGKPIAEKSFRTVESHFLSINATHQIGASPFEILTATAFTIFNDADVNVGVVEVGMGGTLDSTNILNNQVVSVISKIARDHEGFLGSTLSEIAGHKAGILRPKVPYIVSSANEANVINVINDHAKEIGAGPQLTSRSFDLTKKLYGSAKWGRITKTTSSFQQENIKMGVVAAMQTFESMDQTVRPIDTSKTLLANVKIRHHGRQEMVQVPPVFRDAAEKKNHVLVDGAHNPDAAAALDEFVRDNLRFGQTPAKSRPRSGWPVTWVLAMTQGKDARDYLAKLLKPGDRVITTAFGPVDGMPWVKPMNPKELLEIAKAVEPQITGIHVPVLGALRALCAAKYMVDQVADWTPIVLTGSLYLVGDFHRELRPRSSKTWWTDTDEATVADRESMLNIVHAEERERVSAFLVKTRVSATTNTSSLESEEQTRLQDEIDALNREVQGLEIEEQRLAQARSAAFADGQSLSALELFELGEQRFAETHSTPERLAEQMARAEKAEAALARQAERLQLAAEARAKKAESRARQEERRQLRSERRAARRPAKKPAKEPGTSKLRNPTGRVAELERLKREMTELYPDDTRPRVQLPDKDSFQGVQRIANEGRSGVRQTSLARPNPAAVSEEATTRNAESKDALSVSDDADEEKPFDYQASLFSTFQEAGRIPSKEPRIEPQESNDGAQRPFDTAQRSRAGDYPGFKTVPIRKVLNNSVETQKAADETVQIRRVVDHEDGAGSRKRRKSLDGDGKS